MELRPCAIVLCAPIDRIGVTIDRATGRSGISHVCLELGIGDERDPVLLEIDRELGCILEQWSHVVGMRKHVRIPLPQRVSPYVRRRALGWVGRGYSTLAMALQPTQIKIPGVYCSRVVADCLPESLRSQLSHSPAPADFLRFRASR